MIHTSLLTTNNLPYGVLVCLSMNLWVSWCVGYVCVRERERGRGEKEREGERRGRGERERERELLR